MAARKLKKSEQLSESSRYELLVRLASGGMGAVYLGIEQSTEKIFAIKRAHAHLLEEPEFRKMFVAEAMLASRIRHENAIGVVAVDESDGELLMVMEYLEGGSLGEMLAASYEQNRRIPPAVALRIVIDAARGLHSAHELRGDDGRPLGLVHRDVSPQNILVGVDGRSAIVDFGVAKAAALESTRTATDVLKGKMAYMAPEYVSKRIATPQADVFSLGVVCWEALAHRRLFKGEDEMDTMQRVLSPNPAPMLNEISAIDLNVSAIVARALVKDSTKRFRTSLELADALEAKAAAYEVLATKAEVSACLKSLLATQLENRKALLRDALGERRRLSLSDPESTTSPRGAGPSAGPRVFGGRAPSMSGATVAVTPSMVQAPAIDAAPPAAAFGSTVSLDVSMVPLPLSPPATLPTPPVPPPSNGAQVGLRATMKLPDVPGRSQTPAPFAGAAPLVASPPPVRTTSILTAIWAGIALAGVVGLAAAVVFVLRGTESRAATNGSTPSALQTAETATDTTAPGTTAGAISEPAPDASSEAEAASATTNAPVVLSAPTPSTTPTPSAPATVAPTTHYPVRVTPPRAQPSGDWRPKTNPYQ